MPQMPMPPMPTPPMLTPPVLMSPVPTPPTLAPSTVSTPVSTPVLADVDTSLDGSGGGTANVSLTDLRDTMWPTDTDLIFTSGTNKLMLTNQLPLMRSVMQDAFENIRFSLLFNNAFPDAAAVLAACRVALVTAAARSQNPRAMHIHDRLMTDGEYVSKMIRLVGCISCLHSCRLLGFISNIM